MIYPTSGLDDAGPRRCRSSFRQIPCKSRANSFAWSTHAAPAGCPNPVLVTSGTCTVESTCLVLRHNLEDDLTSVTEIITFLRCELPLERLPAEPSEFMLTSSDL